MIHLDGPLAFTPFFIALAIGVPILLALRRRRQFKALGNTLDAIARITGRARPPAPLATRIEVARDNARLMKAARIPYGARTFDWRSGEVRER